MTDKYGFNFSFGGSSGTPVQADRARILIIGDFAGCAASTAYDNKGVHRLDWENFDEVLSRLQPCVELEHPALEGMQPIPITSMEDFHPDQLFMRSEPFASLRDLRARLSSATTFPAAAAELRELVGAEQTQAPRTSQGSDLADLLDQDTTPTTHAPSQPRSMIDALLRQAVGDAIVADPDPEQQKLLTAVDAQIAELMRQVLHDSAFERVESLWRSVYELINNIEDGAQLSLYVTQAARSTLWTDLENAGEELQNSEIYQRLVASDAGAVGGDAWSITIADYQFSESGQDVEALGKLSALARHAGGILLTGGEPGLLGAPDREALTDPTQWLPPEDPSLEHWQALRSADVSAWMGVIIPRALLRYPYGKGSDPVSSFEFEEQVSPPDTQLFLWGNGAFVVAGLLAQGFVAAEGWRFNPHADLESDGFPQWVFEDQTGKQIQPTAEVLLSERTADEISARGLVALCSIKNRNACRVAQLVSASRGEVPLQGAWTG